MSVGSWVLALTGPSVGVATLSAYTGRLPRLGTLAGPTAALSGLPLATYTGALLANTAVPAWHEARRELPFVFGAGAALSAGAACAAVTPTADAAPARRLALGAAIALVAKQAMERRLGEDGEPYKRDDAARFSRLSTASILAGATLLRARGARSRAAARTAGALLLGGAFAERWSVFKAGQESTADPRYVVGPQRRRIERREGTQAAGAVARAGEEGH
jgi:Polysulfide reductase